MALLSSANLFLSPSKTLNPSIPFFAKSKPLLLLPLSSSLNPRSVAGSAPASWPTAITSPENLAAEGGISPWPSEGSWVEFAERVSGEWDGFAAEFTAEGDPVELPENVVPEAFREWEVQVFDWQTQCPTLATSAAAGSSVEYKTIKLLPTVGCEADAATRYSVEERIAGGGPRNMASVFGYNKSGCYVGIWPSEGRGGARLIELEHCLVDPRDREARIRLIQVVRVEEDVMKLERIKVFSEHWDGPYRNGEQLGGCAIRETGFAATGKLEMSEVLGEWQGTSFAIARLPTEPKDTFLELIVDKPYNLFRHQQGLVLLPKQLWCSYKNTEDGESCWEVGWLLEHGNAMASRCVFMKSGFLKEITIGRETAFPKEA